MSKTPQSRAKPILLVKEYALAPTETLKSMLAVCKPFTERLAQERLLEKDKDVQCAKSILLFVALNTMHAVEILLANRAAK